MLLRAGREAALFAERHQRQGKKRVQSGALVFGIGDFALNSLADPTRKALVSPRGFDAGAARQPVVERDGHVLHFAKSATNIVFPCFRVNGKSRLLLLSKQPLQP
jgi:hypothetical protein